MLNFNRIAYVLFAILFAIVGIVIFHSSFSTLFPNQKQSNVFTPSELIQYNGVDKPELYLAIMGVVYNVTKGEQHYGRDKEYHVFVGKDATKSFVTGVFTPKEITDDVIGLTNEEYRSLLHWIDFYQTSYQAVGTLIGRYYDTNGNQTPYNKQIRKLLTKAKREKDADGIDQLKYPPCNVEWSPEMGSRVWCTKQSGGINRNWIGVPRKYYRAGSQDYRCACIKEEDLNHLGNIRIYDNCDVNTVSCIIKS